MINAHIEMDLNQHTSVVSAKIVELMDSSNVTILESLMKKFLRRYEYYTPDQFVDGLTFLYAIDFLDIEDYRVILQDV